MPRRLFKKGDKRPANAGRKTGTPNKTTASARQMLELAAERIGGLDRLVTWILKRPDNERLFWSQMYPKLLPLQVRGGGPYGELELNVTQKQLTPDELETELVRRGLPTSIFGIDKPPDLTNGEGANDNEQ